MEQAALEPVDAADVTVRVDTFVDILMPSTQVARRAPLVYEWSEDDQLRAEHGLGPRRQLPDGLKPERRSAPRTGSSLPAESGFLWTPASADPPGQGPTATGACQRD